MSLTDKKAFVTGACSGIGYAISEEFLKNNVKILIVVDIHLSEPENISSLREKFPKATIKYFSVDVRYDEKVKKCFEDVEKQFGSLDIVVNCAGIMGEQDYKKVLDINLGGVIGSTFCAIENMRKDMGKGHGGVIVNFASILGLDPASILPTYSATKHGVIAFHRSLAHNNDNLGIKFISICPGMTETLLYKNAAEKDFYYLFTQEKREKLQKAMKRQTPDVIAVGLVKLLNEAKNGSVWIIEDSQWKEETFSSLKY